VAATLKCSGISASPHHPARVFFETWLITRKTYKFSQNQEAICYAHVIHAMQLICRVSNCFARQDSGRLTSSCYAEALCLRDKSQHSVHIGTSRVDIESIPFFFSCTCQGERDSVKPFCGCIACCLVSSLRPPKAGPTRIPTTPLELDDDLCMITRQESIRT